MLLTFAISWLDLVTHFQMVGLDLVRLPRHHPYLAALFSLINIYDTSDRYNQSHYFLTTDITNHIAVNWQVTNQSTSTSLLGGYDQSYRHIQLLRQVQPIIVHPKNSFNQSHYGLLTNPSAVNCQVTNQSTSASPQGGHDQSYRHIRLLRQVQPIIVRLKSSKN